MIAKGDAHDDALRTPTYRAVLTNRRQYAVSPNPKNHFFRRHYDHLPIHTLVRNARTNT